MITLHFLHANYKAVSGIAWPKGALGLRGEFSDSRGCECRIGIACGRALARVGRRAERRGQTGRAASECCALRANGSRVDLGSLSPRDIIDTIYKYL